MESWLSMANIGVVGTWLEASGALLGLLSRLPQESASKLWKRTVSIVSFVIPVVLFTAVLIYELIGITVLAHAVSGSQLNLWEY